MGSEDPGQMSHCSIPLILICRAPFGGLHYFFRYISIGTISRISVLILPNVGNIIENFREPELEIFEIFCSLSWIFANPANAW